MKLNAIHFFKTDKKRNFLLANNDQIYVRTNLWKKKNMKVMKSFQFEYKLMRSCDVAKWESTDLQICSKISTMLGFSQLYYAEIFAGKRYNRRKIHIEYIIFFFNGYPSCLVKDLLFARALATVSRASVTLCMQGRRYILIHSPNMMLCKKAYVFNFFFYLSVAW